VAEKEKIIYTWDQKKSALARQLRPFRNLILGISLLEILISIGNGIVPYITGKFVDALVHPGTTVVPLFGTVERWEALIGAWFLVQAVSVGINFFADRRNRRLTTELEAGFQARAYMHLLTLPVSFYKHSRVGEITDNIGRAAWMLSALTGTITNLAPQFLTIVVGIVVSFIILPQLAAILLVGILVYVIILVRTLPETSKYQSEAFEIWKNAAGDAQDAYQNFQTVKQAGAEAFEQERIREGFYGKAVPIWYRLEKAWSNMAFAQRAIVMATQTAIFLLSVYFIGRGEISIGGLIAFNAYAGMIIGPFVQLGNQWQNVQNGLVAVARSERVFGAEPELYAPAHAQALGKMRGDVSFRDVHFSYEPDQPEVLRGFSFVAHAGEIVALVGETGVGKSTTAELVSGYYFPNSGTVEIDGKDIRTLDLRELRDNIAVVPQEVVLFNASIKDNIRYGRPDATDEEVAEAAKRAHADAFIDQFPKKYEQEVGERGIKLSVGQKQRVAIARAMLRNPRILILDEPTSALDAETERYITVSLEELMRGRTTFIIAHRLSTVRKADKILVLKEGQVAEEGTHDELVAKPDGIYRRLYELHIGLHE